MSGTCTLCGDQVFEDEHGALIDNSGGDVCGALGGNEPHTLHEVYNVRLAVVELVRAESPEAAIAAVRASLSGCGFEPYEGDGDVFVSESLGFEPEPLPFR